LSCNKKISDVGIAVPARWRHLDPVTADRPLGPSLRGPGDMVSDVICHRWTPSRQAATAQRGSLVPYTHFSDTLWIMVILLRIWVIPFEEDRSPSKEITFVCIAMLEPLWLLDLQRNSACLQDMLWFHGFGLNAGPVLVVLELPFVLFEGLAVLL
jgi:hypothetical protein